MNDVYEFIGNIEVNGDYVIAAISGGPDSMLLLKILIDLQDKINKKIVVAHVHHNLRKESDEEAFLLEEFCKQNKLIFEMKKIEQYPGNKFSEESARIFRYNFFDELIKKYNTDTLFTAHHGDDLIETILMRLTRGSSIKGYSGFGKINCDRGYKIVRPLIYLTKDEILKELNKLNIWYAIDMSNGDQKYKRNRFRKKILPHLKEENKDVHKKFLEFSEKIIDIDKFIKKQVSIIKNEIIVNNSINVCEFNKLDDIIKMYLIEDFLYTIYKNNINRLNSNHVNIIIDTIKEKNNTKIVLPLNKIGILEYNNFKIIDNIAFSDYDYILDKVVKLPDNKVIEIDNTTKDTSNYVIHLNSDEIKLPIHVRTKKIGDTIKVKNLNGSKSISDIFTDAKISKELRCSYPIVTDDNGIILWIPGIKKSNLDRKKDGKYDIILRYH